PPETVPNQMWYMAMSRAATARRPSMAARRLLRAVTGAATTSVTRLWAGVDTDQLRARRRKKTGATCDDAAWRPRRGESASWSRLFSIGALWGCSLRTVGHVAKSQRNLCECVALNWEIACSASHSWPLVSGVEGAAPTRPRLWCRSRPHRA